MLGNFKYTVRYRSGRVNENADFLSRILVAAVQVQPPKNIDHFCFHHLVFCSFPNFVSAIFFFVLSPSLFPPYCFWFLRHLCFCYLDFCLFAIFSYTCHLVEKCAIFSCTCHFSEKSAIFSYNFERLQSFMYLSFFRNICHFFIYLLFFYKIATFSYTCHISKNLPSSHIFVVFFRKLPTLHILVKFLTTNRYLFYISPSFPRKSSSFSFTPFFPGSK